MTYSIEEAREAYATSKITLDEYTLAIDRAIEKGKPQPRFSARRAWLDLVNVRQHKPLSLYQRKRRAWLFWWAVASFLSGLRGWRSVRPARSTITILWFAAW